MPTPSHRSATASRRFVVWLLLVAFPLYGLSTGIVQLLGTRHAHPQMVAAAGPAAAQRPTHAGAEPLHHHADARIDVSVLVAAARAHPQTSAAYVMRHTHDLRRAATAAAATAAATATAVEPAAPHAHAHAAFERHHHDAGSGDMSALDAAAEEGSDGASGGAVLVLAPGQSGWTPAPRRCCGIAWHALVLLPLERIGGERIERPPHPA